jgi:predicted DNA-binding transcriptional regulator AlpA
MLAAVLTDLAAIGRKLVDSSESALALLNRAEAQCDVPETPMSTSPAALMTRSEVAALLRIDPRTLSRWCADPSFGFPEPVHRARVLRWKRTAIERWLAARES